MRLSIDVRITDDRIVGTVAEIGRNGETKRRGKVDRPITATQHFVIKWQVEALLDGSD